MNTFPYLVVDRAGQLACVRLGAPGLSGRYAFSLFVYETANVIYDVTCQLWLKNRMDSSTNSFVLRKSAELDEVPLALPLCSEASRKQFGVLPVAYSNPKGFYVGLSSEILKASLEKNSVGERS